MSTSKPPYEQVLINPVQDYKSEERKLQAYRNNRSHGSTDQNHFIHVYVSQGYVDWMILKVGISLALCYVKLLLDLPSLPQPPPPDYIKVGHNTTHVTVGDKQEKHVVHEAKEVQWKMRVSALSV